MIRIEIGKRNYLLYLLLPHPMKVALLSPASRDKLDRINRFLTRGEFRSLCRRGGFEDVRISAYWFPYSRRLVPDQRRRFQLERGLGCIPGLRHFAALLAVEARRGQGAVR